MWPFKIKINVDEFVATIYNTMAGWKWCYLDKNEYLQKIEEKEEIDYRCFSLINASESSLSMEEWQHELLNALFTQRVAQYFDQVKILSFEEAEIFLYARITYYFEIWQKYNNHEERPKLLTAISCMLVNHKTYEEYMSKEEEIDWSPEFMCGVGLTGIHHTLEFAKYFMRIDKKYHVIFNNDDAIRHTTYAIRYNELANKWRKITTSYN